MLGKDIWAHRGIATSAGQPCRACQTCYPKANTSKFKEKTSGPQFLEVSWTRSSWTTNSEQKGVRGSRKLRSFSIRIFGFAVLVYVYVHMLYVQASGRGCCEMRARVPPCCGCGAAGGWGGALGGGGWGVTTTAAMGQILRTLSFTTEWLRLRAIFIRLGTVQRGPSIESEPRERSALRESESESQNSGFSAHTHTRSAVS